MISLDSGDKIQGDAATAAKVDYTISGLDANAIKQLADGQLADSIGDLYTADSVDVVATITLVNTHTSVLTCNLYLTPSGGTARRIIPKDYLVAAGASVHFDGKSIQLETASESSADVAGPSSSTDNALARFSGTTGKIIQDYTSNPPTVSDTGDVNIDGDLDVENIVVSGTVDGKDVAGHVDDTTTAHGAVSAATASKIVVRDAEGQAKFAAPAEAGDALIKGTRVTTAELPAMTDEKIWKGTGTNVEEVDVYTDAAAVSAVEAAGLTLAVAKYITITTPTGDHTASGWVKSETAGTALVFGQACYVGTDAKMEKALADDAAITIPATHLCLATIDENATGLFLIYGEAYDASWSFDIGKSVYLSAGTAGLITKTMPTKVTGNQVQVLGQCVMTTAKILWNPSMVVMEYA